MSSTCGLQYGVVVGVRRFEGGFRSHGSDVTYNNFTNSLPVTIGVGIKSYARWITYRLEQRQANAKLAGIDRLLDGLIVVAHSNQTGRERRHFRNASTPAQGNTRRLFRAFGLFRWRSFGR